jgi:hypothetical protein
MVFIVFILVFAASFCAIELLLRALERLLVYRVRGPRR